jgi:elongation factor Ts
MITAQLVKELRERTGISMMDCKNALSETNGDVDAAIEVLRKKSVLKAEKKADRATNEGALVVGVAETYGFIVEVNTETDFAAKDQDFQEFLNVLREYCIAEKPGSLEELNDGENIKISNYQMIEGDASSISSYTHSDGKLASLVLLANSNDSLGKDIAMQVAANNPLAISPDDIDVAILDKEKEIALATLENENKPEEIKEKIVLGKLNKFKQENSLLEQPFIKNPDQKIQDLTKDNSILGIIRRKVGE